MVHPDDYRLFDTLCTVDDKYNLGPDSTRIVKVGRTKPPYTVKIDSIMFRYIDGIMDMLYYVGCRQQSIFSHFSNFFLKFDRCNRQQLRTQVEMWPFRRRKIL